MRLILIFVSLIFAHFVVAQNQIILDERVSDWDEIPVLYKDLTGDGVSNGIDFDQYWVENDDQYLYFRIELGQEINFQSGNDLAFYIDIDNNPNTGFPVDGIGADLRYFPGLRFGFAHFGNQIVEVRHNDIGLMSSPTVSSDFFEIAILRNTTIDGFSFEMGPVIRTAWREDIFGGDRLPDGSGGLLYEMSDRVMQLPTIDFGKNTPSDLRVISHNALRDGMFEFGRKASFERLLQSTQPDIIGYQEIYNQSATDVKNFVSNTLPGQTWYAEQRGPDVFVVSKYPITRSQSLDGNGAFLLDLGDKDLLFIVAHLPCCDNEDQRQREADRIMGFIRDAKAGIGTFTINENTPIVIVGDMNLVGFREQQQTLITGNIINETLFGSDAAPDWDDSDLEDAVPYATGLPAAATWVQPGSSFSPGRLDYILYSGSQMEIQNTYAIYTEGMTSSQLNQNNLESFDAYNASDHLLCVADFSFDIQTAVDAPSIDISHIKVFPNPVSGRLHLEFYNSYQKQIDLSIIDAAGNVQSDQKDRTIVAGRNTIDLDVVHLPSGRYHLYIGSSSIPFIKQ
jgi:endonuclease/exonuclease/phosphatase family metal-dependent hydrolase